MMEVFRDDFIRNFCIGVNVSYPERIAMEIKNRKLSAPCNVLAGEYTKQTNIRNGVNYNLIITEYYEERIDFLKRKIE